MTGAGAVAAGISTPAAAPATAPLAPVDVMARMLPTPAPDLLQDVMFGMLWIMLPVVLVAAACSLALAGAARVVVKPSSAKGGYTLIVAFAALGAVAGLVTGNSREPIAGPLLTGLLGLITALLSYLFGREALATYRPYIPFFIIAVVLTALGGLTLGSSYRKRFDINESDQKRRLLLYEKVQLEVWREEELLKLHRLYPDVSARVGAGSDKK